MEIDFFDYVNNRVLFQLSEDKLLNFVAIFFKNPNFAKCNYQIYDKELLAIIQCFK